MPSSLKSKIKKLYFQGKITEVDYHVLINKIDNRSERIRKLLKENKPKEAKWKFVWKDEVEHLFCTNCWWHTDSKEFMWLMNADYCPSCGAKIVGCEHEVYYSMYW